MDFWKGLSDAQLVTVVFAAYAAIIGLVAWLRRLVRWPGGEPPAEALALHPYEIAYLSGGTDRVNAALLARLLHSGVLKLEVGSSRAKCRLWVEGRLPENGAHPLDRVAFAAAAAQPGRSMADLLSSLSPLIQSDASRPLRALGLLRALWLQAILVCVAAGFVAACPLIGNGIWQSGEEVSRFPIIGYALTSAALFVLADLPALLMLSESAPLRSRRGDRVLAHLKKANAALGYTKRRQDQLSSREFALAVALFGPNVLAGTLLADLQTALASSPPAPARGA